MCYIMYFMMTWQGTYVPEQGHDIQGDLAAAEDAIGDHAAPLAHARQHLLEPWPRHSIQRCIRPFPVCAYDLSSLSRETALQRRLLAISSGCR